MNKFVVVGIRTTEYDNHRDVEHALVVGPFDTMEDGDAYVHHHVDTVDYDSVSVLEMTSIWGPQCTH